MLITHAWKALLVVAVTGGGLWTATHRVAGVAWTDVAGVLQQVAPDRLALLAAIWLGGLGVYTLVLSAALPGLGVRRSLLLNLSGSAVSNVVPLGGAVGTALNWRMVTRWGHSSASFVSFCVLTNVLDVLTKLVLPLVAVAGLVAVSTDVPTSLWVVAGGCVAGLAGAASARLLVSRASPGAVGRGRLRQLAAGARESLARAQELFTLGWPRLVVGSIGYIAAQIMLLDVCLRSVGVLAPLTVVVAAAAVERLATLLPITPGGTGVAEIGAIAWLVAAGQPPVGVVAGVLLCRIFLVLMEIPVGACCWRSGCWLQRPGHRGRVAA